MTDSPPRYSGEAGDHVRSTAYHRPVLVEAAVSYWTAGERAGNGERAAAGIYLDGTVGGGGHAEALLRRLPRCRLLAVDRDPAALDAARTRLAAFADRVSLERMSFCRAAAHPRVLAEGLAGALLDLGTSSRQLDDDRRGFTFRRGAPLDMRMGLGAGPTAAALLASASRGELVRILREGDAPRPVAVAAKLVGRRAERPLRASDDLVAVLESVLNRRARHGEKARLFQALRMAVNDEKRALAEALPAIRDVLRPGAVLVVISYHSVEDRLVKQAFREWGDPSSALALPRRVPVRHADLREAGVVLTRRPVMPGKAEVQSNTRARPARLRAWRRAR